MVGEIAGNRGVETTKIHSNLSVSGPLACFEGGGGGGGVEEEATSVAWGGFGFF